jgi:putative component of toxin-antitoxin plasmid stabilization module
VYEIRHYLTTGQKDVFMEWRRQIRDPKARVAVDRRINRIELTCISHRRIVDLGEFWEKK